MACAGSNLDRLHLTYTGPVPARLRAAALAGGSAVHMAAEAVRRAAAFAALAADTRHAIARTRQARGTGPRLARLCHRLTGYRTAAVAWMALAAVRETKTRR